MIIKLGTYAPSPCPTAPSIPQPSIQQYTYERYTDVASWCWALMCLIFGIHALVGATSPEFAAFCLDRWTFLGFGWLILLADCTLFHLVHRVSVPHYWSYTWPLVHTDRHAQSKQAHPPPPQRKQIHARVLKGVRASDRNSSSMLNISSLGLSCSISTTGPRRGPGGLKRNQRDSQHEREEEEVEEDDALETLRRRRAALHARRYQEQQHARQQYQKQQQLQGRRSSPKNMIGVVDPALAATMGSSTGGGIGNNHHNADAGVLRHPPRHWSLGGVLSSPIMLSAQPPPPLSQSGPTTADEGGGDAVGLGFTPREAFFFNYGTEALNIVRCLYLAAWLCTYAVPAFLNGWFPSVGWALFYILVIPIPVGACFLGGAIVYNPHDHRRTINLSC